MGVTVRRAKSGNWLVTTEDTSWTRVTVYDITQALYSHSIQHMTVRTYTCTTWTDAIRVANDLARDRAIDPNRIIALSERRV